MVRFIIPPCCPPPFCDAVKILAIGKEEEVGAGEGLLKRLLEETPLVFSIYLSYEKNPQYF